MNAKELNCALDKLSPETLGAAAEILKTLSHPIRLRIIDLLNTADEITVGEITDHLEITQSSTSQHLNHMRRVGLVKAERRGKKIWYSIADHRPIALLNCICSCCKEDA